MPSYLLFILGSFLVWSVTSTRLSFVHNPHFNYTYFIHGVLHGNTWAQQIDLLPTVWLHSSVGRAFCIGIAEVTCSNLVGATWIFQVSTKDNCLNCPDTCTDHLSKSKAIPTRFSILNSRLDFGQFSDDTGLLLFDLFGLFLNITQTKQWTSNDKLDVRNRELIYSFDKLTRKFVYFNRNC